MFNYLKYRRAKRLVSFYESWIKQEGGTDTRLLAQKELFELEKQYFLVRARVEIVLTVFSLILIAISLYIFRG
jgi:hypothetical protein